jgi:uncharacterized protein (TIGR03000 family)
MCRAALMKVVLMAMVVAALVSLPATTAEAGWGHYSGWGGWCCPSYVGVYTPAYVVPTYAYSYSYGCCSSCYSWGCYGGCHGCYGYRHAYRHGYWAPGYAYYSAPVYYGYPTVSGCCGNGTILSTESSMPVEAAPHADSVLRGSRVPPPPQAGDTEAAPADAPPAKKGGAAKTTDERSTRAPVGGTLLTVRVPADAKVYINGNLTQTAGTQRRYVSMGLEQGRRYTYEVRAVLQRDGQQLADTKSVQVGSGDTAVMSFGFDSGTQTVATEAVETSLTLYVPDDAKVSLAGNPTDATGAVRHFVTRGLARGTTWEDYRILVTVTRDGRPQTEEKTIRVLGGQSQAVAFDFPETRVASR